MTKKQLIKRIERLGWGDILWGYDANGTLININQYDEESDAFLGYVEGFTKEGYPTLVGISLKFEELPQKLARA